MVESNTIKLLIFFLFAAFLYVEGGGPAFGQSSPQLPGSQAAGEEDPLFDFLPEPPEEQFDFEDEDFGFEKSPEEVEEELRRESFDAALGAVLPLRPNEIRKLLEHFDRTQESVSTPVYPNPKPEVAVETLSLDPGTQPKTIKVAYGYVTTLNIVDVTGAPWPIEDITWAGNFEIIEMSGKDGATHFIRISPQSEFAYGNISIHLLTLQTPVILSLETSRDLVHYRFDAIIPDMGPFAKVPIVESNFQSLKAGDVDMATILEGVVPENAQKLNVSGVDGRTTAYKHKGITYLRTPLTLLSPSWIGSASSADGLRVYALSDSPVLLLSDNGRMVRARLSSRGDLLDE